MVVSNVNRWRAILAITLLMVAMSGKAEERLVAHFSGGSLYEWQEKSFVGNTHYQFVTDAGRQSLEATANGTASGLFREITIDLNKTPYLNWSWWVDDVLQGNDEKLKSGDDYPVRIYVVVSGGFFFWRTRAINYVWSNSQPIDSHWPNAYTRRAAMVAVRSGVEQSGQWVSEKRNVQEDFRRLFGRDIDQIDAVAIMSDSDSDNSGGQVRARYGDIFFSSQ
ncbi:MAG: DUF3047 domain-containing protein [Gammaproteobacteria bacterium]|nr:DUF3047 domain-containing protein [Gammaproteobacteria bacterium]